MFLSDVSVFMLYFIFYFFYELRLKLSIMMSPRYYDVTHLFTDPNENCSVYVKLEIEDILFVRIFLFSEYLLRKLRFITTIVQLPYTSPPISFEPPIRVGSVRDTSFAYLRILFQHKKQKKNIIFFTKVGENQGRTLSSQPLGPPLGGF